MFSKSQHAIRKSFNAQRCLVKIIEKWCKTLDKGSQTGRVLIKLSKAFDFITHYLLIAENLDAYGVNKSSPEFVHSYLEAGEQRIKVNPSHSFWEMILSGVPQGSILGPLQFNISIYDMFFKTENIDFAGTTTFTLYSLIL